MDFEKCKEILLREHEAVAKAAILQKTIEKAAIDREWVDFETKLQTLNTYCTALSEMDKEREALFSVESENNNSLNDAHRAVELAGGDKGRFYTLCMRFSPQERGELCEIYRSLKFEALKLRLAGDTLLGYLNDTRVTMAGFFELAFPDRSGKIYTPHGAHVSHDMRSMVLNKSM